MHADEDAPQRALVQLLQSWRQAGLTHWTSVPPLVVEQPVPIPAAANIPRSRSPQQAPADMPRGKSPSKESAAAGLALDPSRCQTFQPLDLPAGERPAKLAEWKDRVAQCVRCQELASSRKQTVFGVGDPNAKLLFIGEAPGADEDAQGEPFVGRAGQLLNDIIKACKLRREDVYICNILRCRPPGNRVPALEEAENCREYLDAQIGIVNPDYIVCWGSTAAKNLLGSEDTIGKLRGKIFHYGRAKVVCTYHPSYLLRNPPAKKDVWDDMKFLFKDMGIDLTAK